MTSPTNSTDLVIDVHGLNKHFGDKHVVRDFDMQVRRGEIYGFLGPNGSGKTTSIRMICGLLKPDSGSGTCLGHDVIRESYRIKREVGYMTQRFSLWEDLSIRENLDFVARMYGMRNRRETVQASLESLGLAARQDQLAGSLSGGWKQRLALAACLLHQPKLLLLDEPTAGVDPKARRDFWEHIHALAGKGLSVLVSTHYMDEAERCHRLAYIAYGKLLVTGTTSEVIASQHLVTFAVSGEDAHALTEGLRSSPAVAQVTPFGNVLHVTGRDETELARAIAAAAPGERYRVEKIETTLEDVFINLMGGTQDNFQ
ncbi:MAG TPA: ABC transporter ATP-binding protein [Burkholderiales bacterium]|nr:ABC transporter ATP-binding protein [Burkholderiales bacterium]